MSCENWPKMASIISHLQSPLNNPSGCWNDYNSVWKHRQALLKLSSVAPTLLPSAEVPGEETVDPDLYPDLDADCGD